MASDNDWLAFARPFYQAATAAGTIGGGVAIKWVWDWWRARKSDSLSEEQRQDAARQKQIDGIDTRNRADIERMQRDNDRLQGYLDRVRGERDAKDDEMDNMRWRELKLRNAVYQARQVAESFCRVAQSGGLKIDTPVWEALPGEDAERPRRPAE